MYALTACRIGREDLAWKHFLNTASIDLIGGGKQWAGEIYIGGTHPAANGGAWMIAVLGFAGLSVRDGAAHNGRSVPIFHRFRCPGVRSLSTSFFEFSAKIVNFVDWKKLKKLF
jgi:hypothetical protein